MKRIFADTLYWGAVLHERDQYRAQAIRARATLGDVALVTTGEVLAEFLDGLAHRGPYLRQAAARAVRKILTNPRELFTSSPTRPSLPVCNSTNNGSTRDTALSTVSQ